MAPQCLRSSWQKMLDSESKHIHGGNEIQMFCLLLWFKSTLNFQTIDVCLLSLLILNSISLLSQRAWSSPSNPGWHSCCDPSWDSPVARCPFPKLGTNGKKWRGICCIDTTYRTQEAQKTIWPISTKMLLRSMYIYIYDKCAWFSVRWDS